MSVPVNQRTHGKLEAYTKAYELAVYTLQITKNKNIFKEEYQDTLINYLISAALDVYMFTGDANDIRVVAKNDLKNFKDRIELQRHAIRRCSDMNKLILLSKPIFHLSSKRIKFWTDLVQDTKNLLINWKKSDIKRYKSKF